IEGYAEPSAHRRLASILRLKPNRKLYGPLGYFVVRADHPFHPGLNTEWHLGDSRDWMQHIATQRTLKSVASIEPAVSLHANGEIVANSVGLRTVRNNRVEGLLD